MKKIILPLVVFVILILAGGGFFWWWQNQEDVRELNKTLPKDVRVEKSLFGQEYKVVNKIDGYEFKVPREWKGISDIEYIPERTEEEYVGTSLNLEGKEGFGRIIGIDQFKAGGNMEGDLGSWAESEFNTFGLVGDFVKAEFGKFEVVKTQENIHFGGEYVYFFRAEKHIYSITGPSEEFIRYIIINGKW